MKICIYSYVFAQLLQPFIGHNSIDYIAEYASTFYFYFKPKMQFSLSHIMNHH